MQVLSIYEDNLINPRVREQRLDLFGEYLSKLSSVAIPPERRRSRRAPDTVATGTWKTISRKDFPRVSALSDFELWIQTIIIPEKPFSAIKYLTTSPGDPEEFLHPVPKVTDICIFDGHSRCDLHILGPSLEDDWGNIQSERCGSLTGYTSNMSDHPCLPNAPYDLINFQQTLEHLYDPLLAILRLRRILAPGGWIHTSVPHYNIPHMIPNHFWGASPCGLFTLFKSAGLDVKGIGWWGSSSYASGLTFKHTWYDWRDIGGMTSEKDILPFGDSDLAIQTWIIAQRGENDAFVEPFDLDLRPLLDRSSFESTLNQLETQMSVPSGATAFSLLKANLQWMQDDADRLVLAAALRDFFGLRVSQSEICRKESRIYLVDSSIHSLAQGALGDSFPLVPLSGENNQGLCVAGAVISDLWTRRIDPFYTLDQIASLMAPGALLFISCQVAGDARTTNPSFGLCTRQGLVATLLRARFSIDKLGAWGTDEYAFETLQGQAPSIAVHYTKGAPSHLSAGLEQPDLLHKLDLETIFLSSNHFQNVLNQRGFIESTVWAIAINRQI